MKYYSDILKKNFNTEKECLEAEKQHALKSNEESKKQTQLSLRKKALAKEIDDADVKVTEANKLYDIAKDKARKILEDANKQAEKVLEEAEVKVREAEENKLKALQTWSKEFGTYSKTYTGQKALEEYKKSIERFNNFSSILDHFFDKLFF